VDQRRSVGHAGAPVVVAVCAVAATAMGDRSRLGATTIYGAGSANISRVATQQVSTHWLRYTTLTWVERNFGYAVARAYAGHTGKNDAGSTTTYIQADIHEVASALTKLTGEPHPLAESSS
jgi:hypothetical protein